MPATRQPPDCAPPRRAELLRELRAPWEWLSTAVRLPSLLRAEKGDGRPILLAPGYMADAKSLWPLRIFLNRLDYCAYDWQLGRNLGDVDEDIERLGAQCQALAQLHQQPVTLIGWSLGGVISREVARLYADSVREVITLGTPVTGGPKYTQVGNRYARRKGINLDQLELEVLERNRIGFEQPITVIYSKSDGIVAWQAALDVYNPQARHICVKSSHLGLGVNPRVWQTITGTLLLSTKG